MDRKALAYSGALLLSLVIVSVLLNQGVLRARLQAQNIELGVKGDIKSGGTVEIHETTTISEPTTISGEEIIITDSQGNPIANFLLPLEDTGGQRELLNIGDPGGTDFVGLNGSWGGKVEVVAMITAQRHDTSTLPQSSLNGGGQYKATQDGNEIAHWIYYMPPTSSDAFIGEFTVKKRLHQVYFKDPPINSQPQGEIIESPPQTFNINPNAVDDTYNTQEDPPNGTLDVQSPGVLGNDLPESGLTAELVTDLFPAEAGTVALNGDGSFVATLSQNFFGQATFTYKAKAGANESSDATVTIDVAEVNDNPVATDDTATTIEDTAIDIDVVGGGPSAPDDDPADPGDVQNLAVQSVGSNANADDNKSAQGADLSINPDGTVKYDPTDPATRIIAVRNGAPNALQGLGAGDFVQDIFDYILSDGRGGIDRATVTVTVIGVNDPPVAVDDADSVSEDGPAKVIDVLANDTDFDATDTLIVSGVDTFIDGTKGTVTITNQSSDVTYDPNGQFEALGAGQTDTDKFRYTAQDSANAFSNEATVTVTINGANDAPVGNADAVTVFKNRSLIIDALANDTDADANAVLNIGPNPTVAIGGGTVSITFDNKLLFVPALDSIAQALVQYSVVDDQGATDNANVTITIQDTPTVQDSASSNVNAAAGGSVDTGTGGDVEANVNIPAGALPEDTEISIEIVSSDDPLLPAFPNPANALPLALSLSPDGQTFLFPVTLTMTYLQSVVDNNNLDELTLRPLLLQGNEWVQLPDCPTPQLNNPQSPCFLGRDLNGDRLFVATSEFSDYGAEGDPVPNQNPTAVDDVANTDQDNAIVIPKLDLLLNDTDLDHDQLTVDSFDVTGTHGTVTDNNDGTLTYDPNGQFDDLVPPETPQDQDTFDYTVSDGKGGTDVGTVTITVTGLNDDPVANDDQDSTDEDTKKTIDVVANDNDVDRPSIIGIGSVDTTTLQTKGTVTIDADPRSGLQKLDRIDYDPAGQFEALKDGEQEVDSFNYTLQDGGGATSAPARVDVTVTGVNDAPDAKDDAFQVLVDSGLTNFAVLDDNGNGADSDPEGDNLTVTAVSVGSQGGTIAIGADNTSVDYTPAQGVTGEETFTYTISDDGNPIKTDQATVTVTISEGVVDQTFTIVSGLSFIAFKVELAAGFKANDLAVDLNDRGATISRIYNWDATFGFWEEHNPAISFRNNFDINNGVGFFIANTGNQIQYTVSGTPIETPIQLNIVAGLTSVGFPVTSQVYKANDLAQAIEAQGGAVSRIYNWDATFGVWEEHNPAISFRNNFDIVSDRGYFVSATGATQFDP